MSSQAPLYRHLTLVISLFAFHLVQRLKASNETNSPQCTRLQSRHTELLGAGLLPDHFLLLTKDEYVFELPTDSVDSTRGVSMNVIPETLHSQWPRLWHSDLLNACNSSLRNIFTFTDLSGVQYLIIRGGHCLIIHDLVHNRTVDAIPTFGPHSNDFTFVSSNASGILYAFRTMFGQVQVAQFRLHGPINELRLDQISPFLFICSRGRQVIDLVSNICQENSSVQWWIRNGFTHSGHLYLLSSDRIYIVPEMMWHNGGKLGNFAVRNYEQFFTCSQTDIKIRAFNEDKIESSSPSYSLTTILIIVGVVIVALALVAMTIFCLCWKSNDPSKLRSKSSNSLQTKQTGPRTSKETRIANTFQKLRKEMEIEKKQSKLSTR